MKKQPQFNLCEAGRERGIKSVDADSTGRYLLLDTAGGEICEMDIMTGQDCNNGPLVHSHAVGQTLSLTMHPELPVAATAGHDGVLRVWDLQKRSQYASIQLPMRRHSGGESVMPGNCAAFYPLGTMIAVGLGAAYMRRGEATMLHEFVEEELEEEGGEEEGNVIVPSPSGDSGSDDVSGLNDEDAGAGVVKQRKTELVKRGLGGVAVYRWDPEFLILKRTAVTWEPQGPVMDLVYDRKGEVRAILLSFYTLSHHQHSHAHTYIHTYMLCYTHNIYIFYFFRHTQRPANTTLLLTCALFPYYLSLLGLDCCLCRRQNLSLVGHQSIPVGCCVARAHGTCINDRIRRVRGTSRQCWVLR